MRCRNPFPIHLEDRETIANQGKRHLWRSEQSTKLVQSQELLMLRGKAERLCREGDI